MLFRQEKSYVKSMEKNVRQCRKKSGFQYFVSTISTKVKNAPCSRRSIELDEVDTISVDVNATLETANRRNITF